MLLKRLQEKLVGDIPGIVKKLSDKKELKIDLSKVDLSAITISEPKNKGFGDISTNAALVLAPVLKDSPKNIASIIEREIISNWQEAENIKIAGPGFINFDISKSFLTKAISKIAALNKKYGTNKTGNNTKVQIEFVSANPTGELHIGHGRWAALGDSLCNIYEANGFDVWREYYVNDYGRQIDRFVECIASLYLESFNIKMPYPQDGYPEDTVRAVVDEIICKDGDKYIEASLPGNIDVKKIGRAGIEIMVKSIADTLLSMGVRFDRWFYESSLYMDSNFKKTLNDLEDKGSVYKKDGALWFKAASFGDEKDRVIIRTGGQPTYFASDIMYFMNKASRNFKKLIYILGADHHGYVKRLKAIGKAIGFNDKNIDIIIGQLVRLVKKGEIVKMSKRKGSVYGLSDLVDEVGSDAVRFFFSASSFETPLDFDIELAKQKSNQNPVFYVQYAHARISSVFKKIKKMYSRNELGLDRKAIAIDIIMKDYSIDDCCNQLVKKIDFKDIEFKSPEEISLVKTLIFYPDIIFDACKNNAPYLVNQYLYRLASGFHYFYNHCRIIDNSILNPGRFKIIVLARTVLKNALDILGVSAPQKM